MLLASDEGQLDHLFPISGESAARWDCESRDYRHLDDVVPSMNQTKCWQRPSRWLGERCSGFQFDVQFCDHQSWIRRCRISGRWTRLLSNWMLHLYLRQLLQNELLRQILCNEDHGVTRSSWWPFIITNWSKKKNKVICYKSFLTWIDGKEYR